MRRMKVAFLSVLLAVIMSVPTTVLAQRPGDYMGNVLNTDIRVYINGMRIQGYNIDGNTYVVAEHLRHYGFNVHWNEAARSLSITVGQQPSALPGPVPDNQYPVGSVAFYYFYTDIVAYVDGARVPSHAIEGGTVIRVDTLAQAFGSLAWDAAARTVEVTIPLHPVPTPTPMPPLPPAPTPPPVPAATPTPQPVPRIVSVGYDRISVDSGRSVTVTVVTNREANYVWVELGGEHVSAVLQGTGIQGEKTWSATFYPQRTGDVTVKANITRDHRGAAVKNQRITVTAVVVSIQNINVDRTSISEGQSVTFTIRTTLPVNNVWLEYGGTSTDAYYRYTDGNYKVWEAAIYPRQSERVTIYANAARTYTGVASKTQQITVNKQYVEIFRASPSRTTIYQGESVSVSIETSVGTEQVYLEYDYGTVFASYSRTSGNRMHWTANISPRQSQQVTVAAYDRNNQYQDARTYFYINVHAPAPTPAPTPVPPTPPTPIPIAPVIYRADINSPTIAYGETTFITIEASIGVEYVFVSYDDVRIAANFVSVSGNRVIYTAYVQPAQTQSILVSVENAQGLTAYQNVYVTVDAYAVTPLPGY